MIVIPTTPLGKCSVWLIIAMLILFAVGKLFPEDGIIFTLTMIAVMTAGISSFITGLLAVLRRKEKALLAFVSTLIGALLIWILIGAIIEDVF